MKEQVQSLGVDVLPFDACAEFYVRSFDDWVQFASSTSFETVLAGKNCPKCLRGYLMLS